MTLPPQTSLPLAGRPTEAEVVGLTTDLKGYSSLYLQSKLPAEDSLTYK